MSQQQQVVDLNNEINYLFGYAGVAIALTFANLGAAYGTAKSGVGICAMGVMKPSVIIRGVIPVIMAGILGIYGLIVAVILGQKLNEPNKYNEYKGFKHLGSGLTCGLTSLAAGIAIGVGGEAGVRALGQQDKVFVGMMLILIFAEALGLYGLIVALILTQ
jgi:V-type H+-transporting ATPase proteolipid subunit